jgi:GT2 family glycosyltransferase
MGTSVIICAYTMDRWDALVAAVDSCRHQTLPPIEIILVVDYNAELEDRARGEFLDVCVVANHLTKGLSGARNSGVLVSKGDIVVFLDDDAYAEDSWLENLTSPFEDDEVAGAGGWIVPLWEGREPLWFPRTFYWVLGCSYDGLPESGSTIRNPIGASMAMRRSVFSEVGGFTDGIGRVGRVPLGCEETELCIRYGQRHPEQRIVLVRDAIVHHRVPESRCTWKYFSSRCWAEGISKAAVSSLVGPGDGLSAERAHVAKALPREFIGAVALMGRYRGAALSRAFHTVAGAMLALAGLIRGTFEFRRHPLRPALAMPLTTDAASTVGHMPPVADGHHVQWRPLELLQFDLDSQYQDVSLADGARAVWVEVTRNGNVLGRQVIDTPLSVLPAHELDGLVRRFRGVDLASPPIVSDEDLPRISVVLPTVCRRPDELIKALERLSEQEYPHYEVVVVDNRTGPDAGDLPPFAGGDRVRVVVEKVAGVSSARNRGVAESTAPIVVFIDDDVLVEPGWLRALGTRFATQPELNALGGLILPAVLDSRAQLWFEEYFGGFSQSFHPKTASAGDHDDDEMFPFAPGRYAAGANMAFRREALVDAGGFNPVLGTGTLALGGEDLAVFLELAVGGSTIGFEPSAVVRHHHRTHEKEFRRQVFGYGAGLTAMYSDLIVRQPRQIIPMVARVRTGLRQLKLSRSLRVPSATPSYPSTTRLVELLGMMYGPVAYFRSRYRFAKM